MRTKIKHTQQGQLTVSTGDMVNSLAQEINSIPYGAKITWVRPVDEENPNSGTVIYWVKN